MAHLSRIAAPKLWNVPRKGRKWITRTTPGPHNLETSINLSILLRYVLGYASSNRDIKKILNNGDVKIDTKPRRDQHFPVGLMDIISLEKINKHYRLILNKEARISLVKINKEEANIKPFKIISKTKLRHNKTQLNLTSGMNLLVDKDTFKASDTLLIDLANNKVVDHIPLKEGSLVYLTGGSKIGHLGKVVAIQPKIGMQPAKIIFSTGKDKHETLKEYAFVIGTDKPVIPLEENEK